MDQTTTFTTWLTAHLLGWLSKPAVFDALMTGLLATLGAAFISWLVVRAWCGLFRLGSAHRTQRAQKKRAIERLATLELREVAENAVAALPKQRLDELEALLESAQGRELTPAEKEAVRALDTAP